MTEILLATDLTPSADRSFDRAVQLATATARPLALLHVVPDELLSGAAKPAELEAARAALVAHVGETDLPAGLEPRLVVRAGEPGAAIVAEAGEAGSGLVVLGAVHADLLVRLFRRSVVNHVLRHAPCPVLVVRKRVRGPYRRVLVAIDLSLPSRRALEFALRFLPGADVTLVHARYAGATALPAMPTDTTSLQLDDLMTASLARLAAEGVPPPASITTLIESGTAAAVVAGAVRRLAADVTVVGTQGMTGAANLLLGSVAEELIATLPCDVLAVRPQ